MLPYFAGFAAFCYWAARTRKKAPLYLYIAGTLCALAILAKGLAGLGLPVIVFLAYLLFTWNWRRLGRAQLGYGVLVALLACAVVAIPWHHAMLARHGLPFWDELYGDNHWRRLVMGRHGDRGTFEYFLRELGYAALPWIALVPSAFLWVVGRRIPAPAGAGDAGTTARRQEVYWLGAIWFVTAYAVVSLSMTKFHHYILPGLPGLALVLGCFLDDLLRPPPPAGSGGSGAGGPSAAGAGRPRPGAHPPERPAVHLAVLVRLREHAPGPTLAARPRLPAGSGRAGVSCLAWPPPCSPGASPSAWRPGPWPSSRWHSTTSCSTDSCRPRRRTGPRSRSSPSTTSCDVRPTSAWWPGRCTGAGRPSTRKTRSTRGPLENRTVFLGDRNQENLQAYLGRNRGKRIFFIVEKTRYSTLEGLLPAEARRSLRILDDGNNKFYLASAQL